MFITKQAAKVFEVWNQQQEKSLKRNKKKREAYKVQTKTEALGKGLEGRRTRNMVEGQRLSSNSSN